MKTNRRKVLDNRKYPNSRAPLLTVLTLTQVGFMCSPTIVYSSDRINSGNLHRDHTNDTKTNDIKRQGRRFTFAPEHTGVSNDSVRFEVKTAPPVEAGRALIEASKNLNLAEVREYLARNPQQSDLDEALFLVAKNPNSSALAIVKMLIERGAKIIEKIVGEGQAVTTIHEAVKTGNLEVIKFLFSRTDREFVTKHWSKLVLDAATFRNVDVFRYFWREVAKDFGDALEAAVRSTANSRLPIYYVLKAAAGRTSGGERPIFVISMFRNLPHRRIGNLLLKYIVEDRDEIFPKSLGWDSQELWEIIKEKGLAYFTSKEEMNAYKRTYSSPREGKQLLERLTALGFREKDNEERKTSLVAIVPPSQEEKGGTLDCLGRHCIHAPMLETAVVFGDSEEVRELINLHRRPSSIVPGVENRVREKFKLSPKRVNFDRAYWNNLIRRMSVFSVTCEFPDPEILRELLMGFPSEAASKAEVLEILTGPKNLELLKSAIDRIGRSSRDSFDRTMFVQMVLFPIAMRNKHAKLLLKTVRDFGFPAIDGTQSPSDCDQNSAAAMPAVVSLFPSGDL